MTDQWTGDWLTEAADRLQKNGVYLGGPPHLFEEGGRRQFMLLLANGLSPDSQVLDIGCGSLRAGYWLIHFLNPDRYCGLEPDAYKYETACEMLLEPGLVDAKRPRFDANRALDFSVFERRFDFFLARSVWTHAPRAAIEKMLDGFLAWGNERAVFLTSYLPANRWRRDEYRGDEWLLGAGRDRKLHLARHSLHWIRSAAAARGLSVETASNPAFAFGGQSWLTIMRSHRT